MNDFEAMARAADELLNERGKTHGDWDRNAQAISDIKFAIGTNQYSPFPPPIDEAVAMIATKLGRACTGDATFPDHWDDIAGYATLAASWCRAQANQIAIGGADTCGCETAEDAARRMAEHNEQLENYVMELEGALEREKAASAKKDEEWNRVMVMAMMLKGLKGLEYLESLLSGNAKENAGPNAKSEKFEPYTDWCGHILIRPSTGEVYGVGGPFEEAFEMAEGLITEEEAEDACDRTSAKVVLAGKDKTVVLVNCTRMVAEHLSEAIKQAWKIRKAPVVIASGWKRVGEKGAILDFAD